MLWLTVCGAGLATYATRASFIVVARKFVMPARVQHAFRFLPAAILSALVCSQVFLLQGTTLSSNGPRLLTASFAALIAWRTKSALWTIGGGMGTLWLLQWLTSVI